MQCRKIGNFKNLTKRESDIKDILKKKTYPGKRERLISRHTTHLPVIEISRHLQRTELPRDVVTWIEADQIAERCRYTD
jgi:hypothetical protein